MKLDDHHLGRRGVAKIVGWSLAATASIVLIVLFGVPLAADRLAPLVPEALERRLGDVAEKQVKLVFDGKVCSNAAGQQAFAKLVNALREHAGLRSLGAVGRAVVVDSQRLCAAGRQGLSVRRTAGESGKPRRDRRRAGA